MKTQTTAPGNKNMGKIAVAVILLLVIAYFVVSGVVNSRAEERVAEFVEQIEQETNGEVTIGYDSVDASLFSASATLHGVTVSDRDQGEMFRIGSLNVTMDGYVENERIPDSFAMVVDDLVVVNEELLAQMSSFADIDYRQHPIDLRFGYDYRESGNELDLALLWATEDMSQLSYEMTLSNVADAWEVFQNAYRENQGDPEFSRQQQQAIEQQLQSVRFNRTHVRYENDGEVELMLEAIAREQGLTGDQLKSQLLMVADQQLGDSEAARNIRAFIDKPEQITLSLEPEEPLTMEQLTQVTMMVMMGATDEAVQRLGLEVTAN